MLAPDAAAVAVLLPGEHDAERRATLVAALPALVARRAFVRSPTERAEQDERAARASFERLENDEFAAALELLLAAYLGAALPREAFARWRRGHEDVAGAWSALESTRAARRGVPHVPLPGEAAVQVARRLLGALAALQPADPAWRLWHARLAHAERGPAEAERVLAGLFPSGDVRPTAELAAAFVAERAELALSRGAVSRARGELERAGPLAARDPELARLWQHALAAAGAWQRAEEVAGPHGDAAAALPAPLARLRQAAPELATRLAGRAIAWPAPAVRDERGSRARAGAALFAIVAVGAAGDVRVLLADAAPALRARVDAWSAERDGALSRAGAPERELALDPRARRWHRTGAASTAQPWRSCLAGAAALALALEPILDERSELAGWLWLEAEHHLLPAPETLAAWARGARDEVLAAARAEPRVERDGEPLPWVAAVGEGVDAKGAPARLAALAPDDPRAVLARAIGDALPLKLAQRRWWFFAEERGDARPLAEGGGAFALAAPGGCLGLARVRRTGAPFVHHEPDAALGPARDAASGVVVPVQAGARLVGWLALASTRRRDFTAGDVERIAAHVAGAGDALVFAALAAREVALGRGPCAVPPRPERAQPGARDLLAAAESGLGVAVVGPRGAGTTTIARWVLALAGHEGASAREWSAHDLAADAAPDARGARAVLLEGLGQWPAPAQARLAAWLSAHGDGVRVVATCLAAPAELAARGALRPDLAERVARVELRVPSLAERRAELAELACARLASEARARGERAPLPDDGALALLWRQPWTGNLRELGALAQLLVARHAGEPIGEAAVAAAFAARGHAPLERIPSRGVARELLAAAVDATRTATGRINKARAARFLGWDADTLASRLVAARLHER